MHNEKQKESEKFIFTLLKNGEMITDTITIENPNLAAEMKRMISDPNYKPRIPKNDTVFNSKGNPSLVKLGDDFFGASTQIFEYDIQDRLIKITGYDNKNNIQPFDKDIAITINIYDQIGNLVEIHNFQENGKFISSEFEDSPIIKMKYNINNQLIEVWYCDEKGELRSEFSIYKYEYTDKGEKIYKGSYNQKGEKNTTLPKSTNTKCN